MSNFGWKCGVGSECLWDLNPFRWGFFRLEAGECDGANGDTFACVNTITYPRNTESQCQEAWSQEGPLWTTRVHTQAHTCTLTHATFLYRGAVWPEREGPGWGGTGQHLLSGGKYEESAWELPRCGNELPPPFDWEDGGR